MYVIQFCFFLFSAGSWTSIFYWLPAFSYGHLLLQWILPVHGVLLSLYLLSQQQKRHGMITIDISDKKANEREVWIVRHGVKKLVNKSCSSSLFLCPQKNRPCSFLFPFFCGRKLFFLLNLLKNDYRSSQVVLSCGLVCQLLHVCHWFELFRL